MRFDLHVHTALSACAENIMSPGQVVRRAAAAGLNMLAITDHNASGHVRMAMNAASGLGMMLIPGIEVSSREEVHLLALFPEEAALADLQELVDASLPFGSNVPVVFGHQVIFDENDEVQDVDMRLRQVGTSLSLDRLVAEIHARHGFAVPAHAFRPRYSLWSQLGIVDAGAGFDLLEIGYAQWVREHYCIGMRHAGLPAITGSDAHFLENVGRVFNTLPGPAKDIATLVSELQNMKADS